MLKAMYLPVIKININNILQIFIKCFSYYYCSRHFQTASNSTKCTGYRLCRIPFLERKRELKFFIIVHYKCICTNGFI